MNQTETVAMVAITAIIATTPIMTTTTAAYAQFAEQAGQTFTVADIQTGKADYLSAKQEVGITSGSMLPNYVVGQHVTLDYSYPYQNVTVGDVIAFIPDKEEVQEAEESGIIGDFTSDYIMHRVVSVDDSGLTTQGDANAFSIDGLEEDISADQYVGKVVEGESH